MQWQEENEHDSPHPPKKTHTEAIRGHNFFLMSPISAQRVLKIYKDS